MKVFQYQVVTVRQDEVALMLNAMAAEGWELAYVLPVPGNCRELYLQRKGALMVMTPVEPGETALLS